MASFLCCLHWFQLSKSVIGISNGEQSGRSISLTDIRNRKINLLHDEGTSHQTDLWEISFRSKVQGFQPDDAEALPRLDKALKVHSYELALHILTKMFHENGLAQHTQSLKSFLDVVNPFVGCISTLVQSHPEIAGLVWGSIEMVLTAAMNIVHVYEEMLGMLNDLATCLPRYPLYEAILHTPRLHDAVRNIYEIFVNFCLATAKVLEFKGCCIVAQMQFSGIVRDFRARKIQLTSAKKKFDEEVILANTQIGEERHRELMGTILRNGCTPTTGPVMINVPPRNKLFTGREDVFYKLEMYLLSHGNTGSDSTQPKSRSSCAIHAVGGMGKSQVVLEYAHRYRDRYTYIFWLRAETEALLAESFVAIGEHVDHKLTDGLATDKKIAAIKDWLQTSAAEWLLIFDNVESASSIHEFWPGAEHGTILLTTQLPDLYTMTDYEIPLPPLSEYEGSDLIRKHLRRGGSEEEHARLLSKELGGLPLAITHFAGYVVRSACSLEDILVSYHHRAKSSEIWSHTDLTRVSGYQHTLETVWALAFRRLSPDAIQLIHTMAFLEADSIPEEMFITAEEDEGEQGYWDHHKFNAAVCSLRERNLIERHSSNHGGFLKTHRSLQRSILHHLDKDVALRNATFDQALQFVRRKFPHQNIKFRGDTTNWPRCKKYLPHVNSLHSAFMQSSSALPDNIEFAQLLRDGCAFLFNWHIRGEAIVLLGTADNICTNIFKAQPEVARPILAYIKSELGMHDQYSGPDARQIGLNRTMQAIKLYSDHIDHLHTKSISQDDWIALGRFNLDHACCLLMQDQIRDFSTFVEKGLGFYGNAADEDMLKVRYGTAYIFRAIVLTIQHDFGNATRQMNHGIDLFVQQLGPDAFLTHWATFIVAVLTFTHGDIESSLKLHRQVLQGRLRVHTEGHHEILSSKYCIAVAHQCLNDLETAEQLLRDILKVEMSSLKWREEDIARTRYRLSMVLHQQKRHREAADLTEQALAIRTKWDDKLKPLLDKKLPMEAQDFAEDQELQATLFDLAVSFWHGRTTGKWKAGKDIW